MTTFFPAILSLLLAASAAQGAAQAPPPPLGAACESGAVGADCGPCGGPDTDGDGIPRDCDLCLGYDDHADADGDGVPDGCDMCPGADDRVDTDADSIADGCDLCVGGDDALDADDDGMPDGCDRCEGSPDSRDDDGDGVPDGCDICADGDDRVDGDGDGVPDSCDACAGHRDQDDQDRDGLADGCDACPSVDEKLRAKSDLTICYKDGLVGVQTKGRQIGDVLEEMAAQARFETHLPDDVAERTVTVSFEPVPVEHAVRRVLQGTSFTVRYTPPEEEGGPARLAEIRVLVGDQGAGLALAAAGDPAPGIGNPAASSALLHAARNGGDPASRAHAIQLLVQRDKGVETRRAVIGALQDPAPEVRGAALDAAVALGSGAGTSAIARIARNDNDPSLRMKALRALVQNDYPRGTAIAIVEIAARDGDSRVAALARELKAELGARHGR